MKFRIWYQNDTEAHARPLEGRWENLPDEEVQLIRFFQDDGDSILMAGFDYYFVAGDLWGGFYTEPRPWPTRGSLYRLVPGGMTEFLGEPEPYLPGAIPREALRGRIKSGVLISDEKAAALGLLTWWRTWLPERMRELGL